MLLQIVGFVLNGDLVKIITIIFFLVLFFLISIHVFFAPNILYLCILYGKDEIHLHLICIIYSIGFFFYNNTIDKYL